jgi:hypothetical protein
MFLLMLDSTAEKVGIASGVLAIPHHRRFHL